MLFCFALSAGNRGPYGGPNETGGTLIDRAYAKCGQILKENEEKLRAVADFLVENESMTGAQFEACMEGRQIPETSDTAVFDNFREDEE